ncbi:MAG: hypothetical protein EOO27_24255, partial [Comamonadaceae bacterium]
MATATVNRNAFLRDLQVLGAKAGSFYSLTALDEFCEGRISRLPFSLRVVVESVLRHLDGVLVTDEDLHAIVDWNPMAEQ